MFATVSGMTRSTQIWFVLLLTGLLSVHTAQAAAQYEGDPEYELTPYGYRDHTGFFSHVDIGLGYTSASADYSGIEVKNTGIGSAWHIAIGGSVMPRLAVHFSGFGFDTFGGELSIDGDKVKGEDGGITSTALGAGATYYLPINLYFSGSVGVAFPAVVDGAGDGTSLKPGLAARGAVGYEWWVGPYWGLGVAAQVQYLRATDDAVTGDATWNSLMFGPAFTATSN